MDKKEFKSILMLIIPDVVKLIVENYSIGEIDASHKFYRSGVYEKLENEDTKLWHFSPLTLYNMFEEEQKTGKIIFPEEV